MTKQMTMSDRGRAGRKHDPLPAPAPGDELQTEKVCEEPTAAPTVQTCSTPEDPSDPRLPADAAA